MHKEAERCRKVRWGGGVLACKNGRGGGAKKSIRKDGGLQNEQLRGVFVTGQN